jgi:aminoglycoside phosphotransferase (APT) family kinase protein
VPDPAAHDREPDLGEADFEQLRPVLSWAIAAAAPGSRVVGVKGLRDGTNPWLLRLDRSGTTCEVFLKVGDVASVQQHRQLSTAVAALILAQEHALPAPRLVAADLDGSQAGMLAMLTTVLPGSSDIPRAASPNRLRKLGAAAATLHAVPLSPRPDLALRTQPLPDVDFAAWRRSAGTSELLTRAERLLADLPAPGGTVVFVHGDLWQGNTLWSDGCCTGIVDWDCAGAGASGIDIGWLRLDAALYFDASAADEILLGWQQSIGRPADYVAYWDVVAALGTVGDMKDCMPPLLDHGRTDIDAPTLTARRDPFLAAALDRLDRP